MKSTRVWRVVRASGLLVAFAFLVVAAGVRWQALGDGGAVPLSYNLHQGFRAASVGAPPAYQSMPWIRTGGPPGGLGYDIRYNLSDPNAWYVTDAWAGFHLSTDGGQNWVPSNEGITARYGAGAADSIPIFSATVDPHDPNTIWIGSDKTGDIFVSGNGGYDWVEKANGITTTLPLSFRGFTIDPITSTTVYAMGEIGSSGWTTDGRELKGLEMDLTKGIVYKTTDGGENWSQIWYGDNLARYCWVNPRDPANLNDDVLYVSTGIFDREAANTDVGAGYAGGVGILKSEDSGQTWDVITQAHGLLDLYVGSLFMKPDNPDVLLAAASQNNWSSYGGSSTAGVFLTKDGGLNWTRVLSGELFSVAEYCPDAPDVAYAAGNRSVYRSEDGGDTWQQLKRPDGYWGPPGIIPGFPIDFQCDPRDPMRVFANNYLGGNFYSTDGGETWTLSSQGYTGAHIRRVAVVPNMPWAVYAGSPTGVFYSGRSGSQWIGLSNPPSGLSVAMNEVTAMALSPTDPKHLVAYLGEAGTMYTYDGGQSWEVSSGLPSVPADFAFAPSSPNRVYAAAADGTCATDVPPDPSQCDVSHAGLYTSVDGGETWTPVTSTLSGRGLSSVAVHPGAPNTVYAGTFVTGVLQTVNGGATWERGTGLPTLPVRTVALDPSNPNRVFAGTIGDGIYRSVDGGAFWMQINVGLLVAEADIYSLVVDPTDGQVVYAADHKSGVYVSTNGGDTWNVLNDGLDHLSARALTLSADGTVLYVGIYGDGVYRLGTPRAVYLPTVLRDYP